ncbi:AMP binding enzyme [Ceratobasidium sp. AG-Ba]|nr:AMP binding enzyme [Ceratobasidium sp. AG-Ba]
MQDIKMLSQISKRVVPWRITPATGCRGLQLAAAVGRRRPAVYSRSVFGLTGTTRRYRTEIQKASSTLDTRGFRSVLELLSHTANDPELSSKGCGHIVDFDAFIADPNAVNGTIFKPYSAIYDDATKLASVMRRKYDVERRVIMCSSESHVEQIKVFWACVFADAIPCILPKLAREEEQRAIYLRHLATMLSSETKPAIPPLLIASEKLKSEIECYPGLEVITTSDLERHSALVDQDRKVQLVQDQGERWNDVLSLHLTSGSTGFPKAVAITHGNALASSAGKSVMHSMRPDKRFLNWLSMDHVAGLAEFHIWPMFARTDQIHIPSHTLLSNPIAFLQALSHARIDHAFAPMFLLSALLRSLKKLGQGGLNKIKLSRELRIVSGGEAVKTATSSELVRDYLVPLGANDNVIVPGFGLTETCGGFCFNPAFPKFDLAMSRPFGAPGLRNPGTDVRIVPFSPPFISQPPAVPGEIQLKGPNIFKKYWNNPKATAESFTPDGWFRTGDSGYLTADPDSEHMGRKGDDGRLLVVLRRDRDSLVFEGKKYGLEDLLSRIQDADIDGLDPMWCTVFPVDRNDASKGFVLLFRPTYDPATDSAQHLRTIHVSELCLFSTQCVEWSPLRPHTILAIREEQFVPKTTLGKLSMFRMRERYLAEKFKGEEHVQASALKQAEVAAGDRD